MSSKGCGFVGTAEQENETKIVNHEFCWKICKKRRTFCSKLNFQQKIPKKAVEKFCSEALLKAKK